MEKCNVPVRLCIRWVERLHLTVDCESFGEPVKLRERGCLVGESARIVRPKSKSDVEPRQSFGVAAHPLQYRADIVAVVCIGRVQRLRPPNIGQSVLQPVKTELRDRALLKRRSAIGSNLIAPIKTGKRLLKAPQLQKKRSKLVSSAPISRTEFKRPLKAENGLIRPIQIDENIGEMFPRLARVGLELHRLVESLQRVFQLAKAA